jgi:mRNA interferase HigB
LEKPDDIKRHFGTILWKRSASILANNSAVFNIKGNYYRLITAINYYFGIVYIRFVGTHREYDRINAEEV